MLVALVFFITGCEKGKTDSYGKKPAESNKPQVKVGSLVDGGALRVPDTEEGGVENNEGVDHYLEGHWTTSGKHFRKAIETNSDLAEAHYNLALTLDRLGKHDAATDHFGKALALAPDNPKIKDSKILKEHLGM